MLVRERFKHLASWKPNPKNISLFFVYGLLIPTLVSSTLLHAILLMTGHLNKSLFFLTSLLTVVGDLTGAVFICLPLLILVSPYLYNKGLF